MTGHVLWELLSSPNGFIPSVLSENLTFLGEEEWLRSHGVRLLAHDETDADDAEKFDDAAIEARLS